MFPRTDFLGLPLHKVSLWPLVSWLDGEIQAGRRRVLLGLYAACVPVALQNERYRADLEAADLVYADGMGVVWGSGLLGDRVPEKMATTDMLPPIAALAAAKGYRVYLLGGAPGVADRAAERLQQTHRGLIIAGTHHGYFDVEQPAPVLAEVRDARPDILFVGLGVPLQERFVTRWRDDLGATAILTCGGLFDFASGRTPRCPAWMTAAGLEWVYRLGLEPKRLWRRYLIDNGRYLLQLGRGMGRQRRWGH
jgi:N-acetylglucosaminyldiphosphoundecaprenol N-acetyl-beta-D-mannosaminyltransferase